METENKLYFDAFLAEVGAVQNKIFLESNGIWWNLSNIFNEFPPSNNFSFEPQYYLD